MFNFFCSGLYRSRVSFEHLEMSVRGRERKDVLNALALDALGQLCGHTRIHLDGRAQFAFLEDPNRQVARSGSNLEDGICGSQVRLVDDPAPRAHGEVIRRSSRARER